MALTLDACTLILKEHHLLKSVALNGDPTLNMTGIAYDSRQVTEDTLFFCKGNFRPVYLTNAKELGAVTYVAEQAIVEGNGMNALIVTNVQKAMAVLSAAFYDYPQDDLFIVAYTGTKGKTTAAYFTQSILQAATRQKTALFSTIDRVLGPKPEDRFKSDLTTPESLDLFRDMRKAVENGMTHLVMEVSSQAYKKNRVYGLTFDVGFFLNISPDHVGPNEHPNFEDYLHCKLQLLVNSRHCVINAQTQYFADVYAAATTTTAPESIYLFAETDYQPTIPVAVDFRFENLETGLAESRFKVTAASGRAIQLGVSGDYQLRLIGDFNESNATAAVIGAGLAGADLVAAQQGIRDLQIPGRMETLAVPGHGQVYVDYAHNYASMKALLSFLQKEYNQPRLLVVVGSPGDKGVSRRAGFAQVLNEYADRAILTTDDPGFEDPAAIAAEILAGIDQDKVTTTIEIDRPTAIEQAITESKPGEIVVLAAKGADAYQKVRGVDTPYPTDMVIAKQVAAKLS